MEPVEADQPVAQLQSIAGGAHQDSSGVEPSQDQVVGSHAQLAMLKTGELSN